MRATIKGVRDMIRDLKLAVAMVAKYEPLLESDVELEWIKLALEWFRS